MSLTEEHITQFGFNEDQQEFINNNIADVKKEYDDVVNNLCNRQHR